MRTILCILAGALCLLTACRGAPKPAPVVNPSVDIPGEWTLKTLNSHPIDSPRAPWIRIEVGGSLTGWAGVNQISSRLDTSALSRSEFKPSPIISTRMAGPPDSMKLESEFLAALQAARIYSASTQTLNLTNESGGLIATFARKTKS